MNAGDVVALIAEFLRPPDTQERFQQIEQQLNLIKTDITKCGIAFELLNNYTHASIIWFACSIVNNAISKYWIPRSMNPNPENSPISPTTKLQIRNFFVDYLTNKIHLLDESSANFILKTIVTLMKVDFANEWAFWLSFISACMGVPEKIQIGLQLLIFLSDELQAFVDHSVSSKVRAMLRHSFVSLVPQITFQVVNILKDANQNPFPTTVRAFGLLKSFLHWISPNFISPELVEILLNYSRSEVGDIAKEAHDCIFELFSRYDALSVHTVEFRARFLRVVFAFFEYEICLFGTNQVSDAYIKSILHAFQPFAANYFFKQDTFDESIVASFLYNFEQATWKLFGTPHFSMMIEIWGDLLTGKESTYMDPMKYKPHFISLLEHLLDAMISPQLLIHFTEDDNLIVHDVVYEIALCYTFEACKLVHRATATAINNCLPSITALLMCFHNVIRLINDDDPSNETISDSLLRYTNELMTKQLNIDVPQVFAIVQTIIKTYVRKFSRNSLHFVEKVFHLLTVSLSLGPDFIQPMLELLLETVKIHRPMTPCKTLLNRLLEMQNVFSSMPIPIYSLYICCAEIIASFFPTDGGARPLANADVIRQLFSTIFDNLSSPENMPIALQLLRDAVNSIAFSIRATKDLVFSAFVPYIDLIMNIYETNITERAIGPLLDFIASFMTIFPSQIAERMSEFINRLFAPLVSVLPHVADGSFEHYATMSFLKILYQLASFRTAAAALQTINIAKFMVQYTDSLFHGPSIDVLWTCLKIVQILITDRWGLLGEAYQQSLLRILFFDGVCAKDPSSVKISIEAIIEAHKLYQVLDRVDQTFRFNAFSAICNEMCSCSHYMMRDSMVEFAVFFCSMVPDFTDKLLIPFIQQLPIQPMDKEILAKSFCRSFDIDEFRQIFVEFCDDVAYLMGDREE